MSAGATPTTLLTTEELLAMPDDGFERDLIRGELREKPVTRRGRRHSRSMVRIGHLLECWWERLPEPRGEVVVGEAGFRLWRNPDTTVGIDVAYVSAEVASRTPESVWLYDGPPVLAVEILSPSDKQEEIDEKVEVYLESGVKVVWIVNPRQKTILVYRAGKRPELFNDEQELTGDPELPGFKVAVAEIFRF